MIVPTTAAKPRASRQESADRSVGKKEEFAHGNVVKKGFEAGGVVPQQCPNVLVRVRLTVIMPWRDREGSLRGDAMVVGAGALESFPFDHESDQLVGLHTAKDGAVV
jgi:hypothetical protein